MTKSETSNPKHRARAIDAMASELCSVDWTDGFCSPRDGECRHPGGRRDCVKRATGMLAAAEHRGCYVRWVFDPATAPDPLVDAAERAALGEI